MYTRDLTIADYMCKESGEMKLNYLIKELVWTSILAFDTGDTDMTGYSWVLMNWNIDIQSMPKYLENYSFSTQPTGSKAFYATRNFSVKSGDQEIVRAKSLWTIIDLDKRSLVKIPKDITKLYPKLTRDQLKEYQFKLASLEGKDKLTDQKIKLMNEDIDMNGHVNNSIYFKWFEEALDYKEYLDMDIQNIKLIYAKEIRPGEEIAIRYRGDGKEISAEVYNRNTGEGKAYLKVLTN